MAFFSEDQWLGLFDTLADQDYVVKDGFLPDEMYQNVRKFFLGHLEMEDFSKAGIGASGNRIIQSSIRGDYVYWLDRNRDAGIADFFELGDELISMLNRFCYLSLSGSEFHLAHYPAGSFYHKHLDQFKERNNRMISMIIYLNEKWQKADEGQLKIYQSGKEDIIVDPIANRCVLFKSDVVEHEVLKTNASRYSLTGWLLYQSPQIATLLG